MPYFLLGVLSTAAVAAPILLRYGRRVRRRARAAEARAQRSERLAFVGTLAGGLAHEIRNPLSTLSLNLQLLAEDARGEETPEAKRRARRIEVVRGETKRLNDILEEFLRFAREHKLKMKTVDVNQVVGRVLDFQSAEALSRGVQIRSSFGEVPWVRLDEDLFRQAMLNISINAEQAMPEGGDLMVRTYAVRDSVNIDVVDTGVGIPDDVMPRLFDVYFSTKARGTGLGLAMARRIIEEHGGTITVHSRAGEGTCVTISLPGVVENAG